LTWFASAKESIWDEKKIKGLWQFADMAMQKLRRHIPRIE